MSDQNALIARLAARIMDLEETLAEAMKAAEEATAVIERHLEHFSEIEKEIDYRGHPGNLAGVIRSRLGK